MTIRHVRRRYAEAIRNKSRITKAVLYVAAALSLWFFAHMAAIAWIGLRDDTRPADVAVVLGNMVEENGEPSPRLLRRVERAAELYHQGTVKYLILSGGGSEERHETSSMRRVLLRDGIPDRYIISDPNGHSTYLTARNVRAIMQARGFESVTIVTHYYHIARTKLAFRRFGVEDARGVGARFRPELIEPYWLFREFVAYYYYLFRSYPDK